MNDDMNNPTSTLEEQIAQLTTWQGDEPQAWRAALKITQQQKNRSNAIAQRFMRWPLPKALAAAILVVLIGAVLAAIFQTGNVNNRLTATGMAMPRESANLKQLGDADRIYPSQWKDPSFANEDGARELLGAYAAPASVGAGGAGGGGGGANTTANIHSAAIMQGYYTPEVGGSPQGGAGANVAADRAVVRKAQMELITDDVRTAFLKAQHLVSEATGEYVQDSALVGSEKDKNLQANLTLRVTAERLSAVLNDLRALGKVNAESSGGEDVTATMVDLEARLSNEKRVEKELLDLMEKRTDAPLKEILELRDKISQVRQSIEQMTAQRERLGRLVSLATILVLIRTEPQKPEPATQPAKMTIGEYFSKNIAASWETGLWWLADTLAALLRVIVGGIIWWALLVALILFARQAMRRRMEVAATRA